MKEKTNVDTCEAAREKFVHATAVLRNRAEMQLELRNETSFIRLKAHLCAKGVPFTMAEVFKLNTALEKAGFGNIRIPDFVATGPYPTLHVFADLSTRPAPTLASLVHFVKSNPRLFPAGLGTRIEIGDCAGNETCRDFELEANDGRLAILF